MAEFDFAPRPPKQSDDPNSGARAGDDAASRAAARRNPSETSGMKAGLMSMATTLGAARHTTEHIEPLNSPTGMAGMMRSSFGAKHEKSDDHKFDLDLSRNGSPGGGIGGTKTGMGAIGAPVQAAARKAATSSAMRAIGGMSRATGGKLNATMGLAGTNARNHLQWLDEGVKKLYKLER